MSEFVFADDGSPAHHRSGFIRVYQRVFSELPYLETYSDQEAFDEGWIKNLERGGIVTLCLDHDEVVGFGCAVPFSNAPGEVQDFVRTWENSGEYPFEFAGLWYMSELGVLGEHRGRGFGYELIRQRLLRIKERGDDWYLMRTAAEGSNSINHYKRIGAVVIGIQDVSAQVEANGSNSKQRIYLYGSCAKALEEMNRQGLGLA